MRRFLFVLLTVVFCFSSQGFAATLISDNFDAYTTGLIPPSPWEVYENGGSIRVTSPPFFSSPNSVGVTASNDPSQNAYFGQNHTPITNRGTYEAYLRTNNAGVESLVMAPFGDGSGSDAGPWISLGGPGGPSLPVSHLAYWDGSNWASVMPISNDTWYHIKINVHVPSKTYDIYVNNMITPIVTGANFVDTTVTDLSYIGFFAFGAGSNPNPSDPGVDYAYVDNVIVLSQDITAVPAVNKWGMLIFAILSGLGAFYLLRRQRKVQA